MWFPYITVMPRLCLNTGNFGLVCGIAQNIAVMITIFINPAVVPCAIIVRLYTVFIEGNIQGITALMLAVSRQCHTGRSAFTGLCQIFIIQLLLLILRDITADYNNVAVIFGNVKVLQHAVQRIYCRFTQTSFRSAHVVVLCFLVIDADNFRGIVIYIGICIIHQNQITRIHLRVLHSNIFIYGLFSRCIRYCFPVLSRNQR